MQKLLNNSIARYLQYLKEISRKIAVRDGFDTLLLGSRKHNESILQVWTLETQISPSHPDRTHWEALLHAQDRHSDRRLMLGWGLLAGRFNGRRLAAPLLLVELEAFQQPDTGCIELLYDWETLSLNYDLISLLTGTNLDEEELLDAVLLEREFQFVERIENDLANLFPEHQPNLEAQASYARRHWSAEPSGTTDAARLHEFLTAWSSYLTGRLRSLLPRLAEIQNWPHAYRYTDEWAAAGRKNSTSIFDGPVAYVPAAHVALAAVPPQLSAFAALRELTAEVAAKGFRNPLLTKLLGSTLLGLPFELETQTTCNETNSPPIELTQAQQKALDLARHAQLSYIQGPPGTGKSHVIVAVFLDALARGERVLLVSQKEAALTVVADRLEAFFTMGLPPFALYVKADRTRLREQLKARVALGQKSEQPAQRLQVLEDELRRTTNQLQAELIRLADLETQFDSQLASLLVFEEAVKSARQQESSIKQAFPGITTPPVVEYPQPTWHQRYTRIERLAQQAERSNRLVHWYIGRVDYELRHRWLAPAEGFRQGGFSFARSWLRLHELRQHARRLQPANLTLNANVLGELEASATRVRQLNSRQLEIECLLRLIRLMQQTAWRDALSRFEKMLHWRRPALISQKMEGLDYNQLLDTVPLWAAETRHVGDLFPLEPELFDLVIVDEASQVNLAEILPVLYRGKRACIVGDHAQLSIESTGLTFALRRKFDALTWSRYRAASLPYDEARRQQLTVTNGSILDLIRNPAHGSWIPQVMLDEHLRSHPALAKFTARFYESTGQPLRVLTDRADRYSQPAAETAWVGGLRDPDRSQPTEIKQVLRWLHDLTAQKHPFCRFLGDRFGIGILSLIRNQCLRLQECIESQFSEKIISKYNILIGTPEEFQGNERDVLIISLCLDGMTKQGTGHYQNPRRLNVATSRAKQAVLLTSGVAPDWLAGWSDYVRLLEEQGQRNSPPWPQALPADAAPWELLIWPEVADIASGLNAAAWLRAESCSLIVPFAMSRSGRSCALELDGLHPDALRRHTILRRAGWEIIHSPLSRWQQGADWVRAPEAELDRLRRLLAHYLGD